MYPPVSIASVNELRDVDLVHDALNLNNSTLGSITDDLATSLQPFIKGRVCVDNVWKDGFIWTTGDMSTHISAFPFTDSGIFQGGLSFKGDVMLKIQRLQSPDVPPKCAAIKLADPVLITTQERLLAIYSERPPHAPQVQILTNKFDELIK